MMNLGAEIRTEVIKECVKRWESEFDDSVYNKCLEAVKKANLRNAAGLKSEMRRFLYVWGRMGRVLGRVKYRNWEIHLVEKIESNYRELEELRLKDLKCVNLDRYDTVIKKCYESFEEAVGPIAAVKVLHSICPNFFPLWDNGIADALRKECEDEKVGEFSASDYFRFVKNIQGFIKSYERVLTELAAKYKKRTLRILDEFLWWIVHRQLALYFA